MGAQYRVEQRDKGSTVRVQSGTERQGEHSEGTEWNRETRGAQ